MVDGSDMGALAEVMADTIDGIAVLDGHARYVYANRATCRILGLPAEQVAGRGFLDSFAESERGRVASRLPRGFGEPIPPFFCELLGADGVAREVVCATFGLNMGADVKLVIILRELTGAAAATRSAAAVAQAATAPGAGTTDVLLRSIAGLAVESSRAAACGIMILGEDHRLVAGANAGFPDDARSLQACVRAAVALEDFPNSAELLAGRTSFDGDARTTWRATPSLRGFAETLDALDWQGVVCVPLWWKGNVHGLVAFYLHAGSTAPTDTELTFYEALAAQAAVVVANARLTASAERNRLARELHDSVSRGLFSMTMHARAAQLAMDRMNIAADVPLGRAVNELATLTRSALAEMRALIFELRPQALAEEGLVAALRKQADALSAHESVSVHVVGPDSRLPLPAAAEEHLYRIASEALHNVVKHAGASRVDVAVTRRERLVQMTIEDNGAGFDTTVPHTGHLGLSTMAQRADLVGADLVIHSAPPASGTTITVTLALDN